MKSEKVSKKFSASVFQSSIAPKRRLYYKRKDESKSSVTSHHVPSLLAGRRFSWIWIGSLSKVPFDAPLPFKSSE